MSFWSSARTRLETLRRPAKRGIAKATNVADVSLLPDSRSGPTETEGESATASTDLYSSDSPVGREQDRFRRRDFAKRIADTLSTGTDSSSLTVAIHGAWGEGKTTVLDYIAAELRHIPGVVCVNFNPWRFPDESTLLHNFFNTLATALERSMSTARQRIGGLLREYGGLASIPIEAYGVKVSPGEVIKNLGEVLGKSTLEEEKEKISMLLLQEQKRIVVLIDDIDRLEKTEIQAIFKLVRLSADFPFTSYVLAFDQNVVADALSSSYSGRRSAGRQFLEKFIQVPLNLPAAAPNALRDFCLEHIQRSLDAVHIELGAELEQAFLRDFLIYLAPQLETPRAAKRYSNALAFTLPLLHGEVHDHDLLLLEGMKIFYPRLYSAIRRRPSAFVGPSAEFRLSFIDDDSHEFVAKCLRDLNSSARERARRLLVQLFPQMSSLFKSKKFEFTHQDQWDREQRVASPDYLRRYLTLSIPEGDVSDRVIEGLIQALKASDPGAEERFVQQLDSIHVQTLLVRLVVRIGDMDEEAAATVARVLARNAKSVPLKRKDELPFLSPQARAILVIRMAIKRIVDPTSRFNLAKDILTLADPLSFAFECFLSIGPHKNSLEPSLFDEPQYTDLKIVFSQRIAAQAAKSSLVDADPEEFLLLLLHWSRAAGRDTVHAYVRRLMTQDPRVAVSILTKQFMFSPPSNNYTQQKYEELPEFADPVDVAAATLKLGDVSLTDFQLRTVTEFNNLHRLATEPLERKDS